MTIKITLKKIRQVVFFVSLLLISGFVGFKFGLAKSFPKNEPKNFYLFWQVWQTLEEKYLEKEALNPQKMTEGAIKGMVDSLGDPYTVFLPKEENKLSKDDLNGEFGGIGVQLGYKEKTLAVIAPLDKTPAALAGIKAGDLILKIKDKEAGIDKETTNISLQEAMQLIRGPEGSLVTLELFREGVDKPFEISIKRGKIVIPALEAKLMEEGGKLFAYVHIYQFSDRMNEEWLAWAEGISLTKSKENFGGVILDLRDNPGGFLQGAVFVAGEFLSRGETVLVQENYLGEREEIKVDREGKLLGVPLVVLVNKGSASAAEILAGALSETKRAKVVGEITFGKGTVQEPQDLPENTGLHITIARWLLPSGTSIHKTGMKPNFEVKDSTESGELKKDLILEKGIETLINL